MSSGVSLTPVDNAIDSESTVTPIDGDAVIVNMEDRLDWSEVATAVNTQARVIHALIMRETLSRYGDHKLGFIWAILEPLLFVSLLAVTFSYLRSDSPSGMPLVPFMISGFVPFLMFRNCMNQLKGAVASNRTLLGFPQVTIFDVIAARVLLEGAVMGFVFAFILGMAHLIGFEVRIENPLGVLMVSVSLLALGAGLGFFLGSVTPIVPSVGQISGILFGRPLFLTSGLFFTASSVPEPFRGWLLYNPIMHLMELMRSYFFYEFESEHGSWVYAGSWVLGMLAFGMISYQALKRRAIIGL